MAMLRVRRAGAAGAVLLWAAVVAGCGDDAAGPSASLCPTTPPVALAPGVTLDAQAVRLTLTDLAQRVAPSFGSEGTALAGQLTALAAAWPARDEGTCALYDEAREALNRVPQRAETAPDRVLVAFFLDVVGTLLATGS